ncbi:MAG TPA: helix-turn-helix transcriptional regulator [Gemmatimonadales bacterium]
MGASLGEFETLVLLALLHLGEDAYGITVRDEIARRTRRRPSLGTVYKALIRLEAKGLIRGRFGEPTPERGGRRKKHYRVLAGGRRALAQTMATLGQMAAGLDLAREVR